jgi:hypothetical protein
VSDTVSTHSDSGLNSGAGTHAASDTSLSWSAWCSAVRRSTRSIEVALDDVGQVVEGEPFDAMVGHAALREVVGADAFRAIAGTDLEAARLARRGGLLRLFGVEQPRVQQRHRARAVLVLAALVLAFDHDAGRQMRDAHRRLGGVDVLAAGAARPHRVDADDPPGVISMASTSSASGSIGDRARAEVWMRP